MLIIFDLDDTLIDTSGSVTPYKLRQVAQWLEKKGLLKNSFENALKELIEQSAKCSSGSELIESVLRKAGAFHLFDEVKSLYTALPEGEWEVKTTPNAKKVLESIHSNGFILALVTIGNREFQLEKLKKAGFELSIFSKIMVPEDSNKKPYYEALLREFSDCPSRCVAVGDRVIRDLLPAHELGFRTVHMRWGRGQRQVNEQWIDYTIRELPELMEILL